MCWRAAAAAAAAGLPLLATDLGGTAAVVIALKSMEAVAIAHCLKAAFTGGGQHQTKKLATSSWNRDMGSKSN